MWQRFLFAMLLGAAGSAWAAKDVVVRDAWTRPSAEGETTASVQMKVTAVSSSGKLVEVDSPVSESAEIQRLWPSGGKIQMAKVKSVRLPHGHAVEFSASTYFLVLIGLKQPLKEGDHVPFNLTVVLADGRKVTVEAQAEVRPLAASKKPATGEGQQAGETPETGEKVQEH